MTAPIGPDHSERYRELHVGHTRLMQDRYRDQRLDVTRQALASQQVDRVARARELNLNLGQQIDQLA